MYNAEKYLIRCIESVIDQEYPLIEIILVNDGSTDSSLAICQDYYRRVPEKVRVISQENKGASIARKQGIQEANGDFLVFVDSDDFVSPHYVSALYKALMIANANIALCPMARIVEGEKLEFTDKFHTRVLYKDELFRRFFKYEFWGFGGGIYRKDLFDKSAFPKATIYEDYYVKAQMFVGEMKVGYIEEALYCYEQHTGSLSKLPLSLKALGEFDNALATWNYIKESAPKYSGQAQAIASEAACKWLGILNRETDLTTDYIRYVNNIKKFLRQQFKAIMLNPHLLWKLKIVILKNLACSYR